MAKNIIMIIINIQITKKLIKNILVMIIYIPEKAIISILKAIRIKIIE